MGFHHLTGKDRLHLEQESQEEQINENAFVVFA